MASPRPAPRGPWTPADDAENSRLIQADDDRRTLDRVGRRLGFRRGELAGLLARVIDDRIAAAFRSHHVLTPEQLKDPATADAARGPLVDVLLDDFTELVTLLTTKETTHDSRTKKPR